MNSEQLEKILLKFCSRHTISPFKRQQIEKLLCVIQFDDIFLMRTKYADSVCSLLQTKYEKILRKYNNKFWRYGFYKLRKPYIGCFTNEELKDIKIKTYKELRQYYNEVLVPMLQTASEKEAIISINNYKFKKLDDKSHLIK